MLSLEGRDIDRVLIVDDDPEARELYAAYVEDARLEPVLAEERYNSVEQLLKTADDASAQAIVCDFHLSVRNYASFDGASAVARWYERSTPALLCTNFEKAQVDEMRRWRHQIPVLMRPDEFDSDAFIDGIRACLKEFRGEYRLTREPFRTLVRVIDRDERAMYVQVPGWYEPSTAIDLLKVAVPSAVWAAAAPDRRFHAKVNIGATRMEELYFKDWELG
ncbi:MAG: response regulator [Thiohalocapsa sp. PB-PSB1]|jgi:CheY-like chemotaxis protein|nr:MAG: hypothetical protein N838_22810 [Thiohalocapsa sp. PB-PSB1]QQO52542.1 MAG: response regulator [Thiohalocapsa sp. PB-PSB1]